MKLLHRPAAVVFDMDGLLFDTKALYQEAFTQAASEKGYDMPLTVFHSMVGHPWPVNRVQLLDHYGPASWMRFRPTWPEPDAGLAMRGVRLHGAGAAR